MTEFAILYTITMYILIYDSFMIGKLSAQLDFIETELLKKGE